MLPYVIILSIAWTLFFVAWYLLGIPWARRRLCTREMDDSTITFVVLGAAVVLFVWDRLPVAIVAIGVALVAVGDRRARRSSDALAGFGDPTVLFIASLFVVSEALDASGVTAWVGQELVARVGGSRTRLIVLHDGAGGRADGADQRQRRGRGARARSRSCWPCGRGARPRS